jgi:mRNA interferase RelE/StbE
LDKPIKERIARKLQVVAQEPSRYLTRLSSVEAYKLRVGDYRIIVDVDWEGKVVYVLTVGHRSTIYR